MIIAFTKDWDDVPTCTTHILRELGKTEPVLWVGSIGTRKPSATSAKDARRVVRRIWRGLLPPEHKENHLYVLHPLLIPKASAGWASRFNRMVFRWYVDRFERMLRERDHGRGGRDCQAVDSNFRAVGQSSTLWRAQPQGGDAPNAETGPLHYWCFVPNAVDLLPTRETVAREGGKVIYYVADDWTAFHNLDGAWMKAKEDMLVARADVIFATSSFLVHKLQGVAREAGRLPDNLVVHMAHGVDHALFSQALDKSKSLPVELQSLAHPIIGFYGNLHPWVDFGLIEKLAIARPDWTFVLIGEDYGAPDSLRACSNVHLLGRREHDVLVDYCRGFDAAIIPYDMRQARMESVNPVKTKEILSAGVPVVAAKVPALAGYGDDVLLCDDSEQWLAALEHQVVRGHAERAALSGRMQSETWEHKVRTIREIVELGTCVNRGALGRPR